MGASSDNPSDADDPQSVDLSELQSLSFGPNWTERKSSESPKTRSRSDRGKPSGKAPARDRRRGGRPERKPHSEGSASRGDRRPPRRDDHRRSAPPREEFKPVVDVTFYPEDIPFKALSHAMKTNCRTYELFEVARLILEKPERFVVVLNPLKKEEGAAPQEFFLSVPDGVAFLSEDAVVAHVLKSHLEKYFTTEEIETEPPKGNFVTVGKCGITGELLGPPNYHRYQTLLLEHHASRLSNMPFERFVAKIEQVKDPEVVQEWTSKMTKIIRYKPLEPVEGDPEALDGMEAARLFLLTRRRDQVVKAGDHARFSGRALESMPKGDLRRSVEAALEQQQRFPLETANNLRGRLRRMRFTIYKRGSKGVSFVCAVKRHFREPDTKLADSLQSLIEFIEKHPGTSLSDLPKKYLGVKPEEALTNEQEKAPDIEEVPREKAEAIVEEHELRRQERLAAAKAEADAQAGLSAAKPEEETTPDTTESTEGMSPSDEVATPQAEAPANEVAPSAETPTQEEVSPGTPKLEAVEDPRLRQLLMDLRWLVQEGYVVEFGDGSLQAVPYAPVLGKAKEATDKADEALTKPADEPTESGDDPTESGDNSPVEPKAGSPAEEASAESKAEDPEEEVTVRDKKP